MTGVLRVAAWWTLAAVLGWLCLASLFDRLAGQGVLVAAPRAFSFGGNSARARAEVAWRAGDLVPAERLARAAVVRRPVDAAALRLAGSIALGRGEASGESLLRLAGAAGWRDRETQLYWGEAAIAQGAWAVAAERLEALARVGDVADARTLARLIEAAPAGRAGLVGRWDGVAPWFPAMLGDWPRDDPAAMADHFATVLAARPRLDRDTVRAIASPLVGADRIDWAFAILPPDERTLNFAPAGSTMPLDWNLSAAAGLDATVQGDGASLRIEASGPALLPLAARLVRLAAGTTRLTLVTEGARTDLPLIASIDCVTGPGATATPVVARGDRSSFDLTVPPGCPAQWLRLAIAGEEARRGAAFLLYPPTLSRAAAAP